MSKFTSKWDASFNQVRRRSVSDVHANLAITTPFLFNVRGEVSDVPSFIEGRLATIPGEEDSVISLPGRDVNLVRDTLMAASRFYHVIECARAQVRRGSMTWAMVDAYHASLVGAKVIFTLYGLFTYSVRDRTVLVDFRPELGSVDDTKKFRRANRDVEQPIRVFTSKAKYLEQKDAWALVTRLCNITHASSEGADLVGRIKEAAASPLSALRNHTLYDSVAWQWPSDLASPRMTPASKRAHISADNESQSLSLHALASIFEFVTGHIEQLGKDIGYDPTKLSRLFSKPATPAGLLI